MEKVYDEQIAPKLMEIGKLCEENGIPFLAVAEYAPGKRGTTSILGSTPGLAMVILHLCSQTGENIDGFFINLSRYMKSDGIDTNSSMVLQRIMGRSVDETTN